MLKLGYGASSLSKDFFDKKLALPGSTCFKLNQNMKNIFS